jgi:hypothetical protein
MGEKTAKKLIKEYGSLENILANTDKFKGKQQENLINFREQGLLSKQLATINISVPIDHYLDDYIVKDINRDAVRELFNELEFRQLTKRVLGEEAVPAPAPSRAASKSNPAQGDLFNQAAPSPEPVTEHFHAEEDASEDEMWAALRIAQAEDFVRAMPGGLDASIAQGGSNVSGGQRQRLAIARALIRQPEIYLFDDSFSALDLATDARLRAALAPNTSNSVVVVVAQRVSTIREADQILVLEGGHCVGLGTHDELLADCPTYQEIVDSQASVNGEVS